MAQAATQRNTDHIQTTHTGSLPRPADIVDFLRRQIRGEATDQAAFERLVEIAVPEIIARQMEAGIDVVNDGEVGKASYATYIQERLSGFGPVEREKWPQDLNRERGEFPEFYGRSGVANGPASRRLLGCVGPVAVRDRKTLAREIETLKAAAAKAKPGAMFMSAASPGVVSRFHPNFYYPSTKEFREAVGAAMREEYEAIVDAGFILQLDCPDLASGWNSVFAEAGPSQFVAECEISIGILNDALRNVPGDRVRLHLCWGNYEGPHIHDIPIETILPAVLKTKAQVISFEGANPRHAHEWEVWRRVKLPDDKILMPGVIDSTTNFVEHPELVAQRIGLYADIVGRERVIAGVDCGFETFAGGARVDARIVYAKLAALAEGARIATDRFWRH